MARSHGVWGLSPGVGVDAPEALFGARLAARRGSTPNCSTTDGGRPGADRSARGTANLGAAPAQLCGRRRADPGRAQRWSTSAPVPACPVSCSRWLDPTSPSTLVEPLARRTAFLTEAVAALGLEQTDRGPRAGRGVRREAPRRRRRHRTGGRPARPARRMVSPPRHRRRPAARAQGRVAPPRRSPSTRRPSPGSGPARPRCGPAATGSSRSRPPSSRSSGSATSCPGRRSHRTRVAAAGDAELMRWRGVTVPRTGEWRRFDDVEWSGWGRGRRAEWSWLAGAGWHAMGRPPAPQNRILGLQLARSA